MSRRHRYCSQWVWCRWQRPQKAARLRWCFQNRLPSLHAHKRASEPCSLSHRNQHTLTACTPMRPDGTLAGVSHCCTCVAAARAAGKAQMHDWRWSVMTAYFK